MIQNEIYAYYHNIGYGPTWGGGHDLYINPTGKSCYTNLGFSYGNDVIKNNNV